MAVICGTPTPATTRVVQIEPGPMPTLTASAPAFDQRQRGLGGGDVAGDELRLGEVAAHVGTASTHALRVAVRGVDADDVAARLEQRLDALLAVGADADRGADAQPAELVLDGVRVRCGLLDVLDGDEALQQPAAVDDQQLLDAVLVQELLGALERRRPRAR